MYQKYGSSLSTEAFTYIVFHVTHKQLFAPFQARNSRITAFGPTLGTLEGGRDAKKIFVQCWESWNGWRSLGKQLLAGYLLYRFDSVLSGETSEALGFAKLFINRFVHR